MENRVDVKREYTCAQCGKCFRCSSHLVAHSRTHTGEKPYCCEHCSATFTQNSSLKTHLRIHSGFKPFLCSFCVKTFKRGNELRKHELVHERCKQLKSGSASETLPEEISIEVVDAIQLPHKEYPLRLTDNECLVNQCRQHDNHSYVCDLCNQRFTQGHLLRAHRVSHDIDAEYKCDICGQKFVLYEFYCSHLRIHTGKEPYRFEQFDVRLNYHHSALQHAKKQEHIIIKSGAVVSDAMRQLMANESSASASFKCHLCTKEMLSELQLQRHIRYHITEPRFSCEVCGKQFKLISNSKIHARIHTGEKPFHCHTCGATFTQSNSLKVHMLIHEGSNPFICTICDKSFKRADRLRKHQHSHELGRLSKIKTKRVIKAGKIHLGGMGNKSLPAQEESVISNACLNFTDNVLKSSQFSNTIDFEIALSSGVGENVLQKFGDNLVPLSVAQQSSEWNLETEADSLNIYDNIQQLLMGDKIISVESNICSSSANLLASYIHKGTPRQFDSEFLQCVTAATKLPALDNACLESNDSELLSACVATSVTSHIDNYSAEVSLLCEVNNARIGYDLDVNSTIKNGTTSERFTNLSTGIDRIHKCEKCNRKFSLYVTYKAHLRIHSKERSFSCEQCSRKFNIQRSVLRHSKLLKRNIILVADEPLGVTSYESSGAFNRHLCQKVLKSELQRQRHVRYHAIQPRHECGYCGKRVKKSSISNLVSHRRTHSGEKPYCCSTAVPNFACRFCDKRFKKLSHAKIHEFTHTGEKRFSCGVCSTSFTQNSTLRVHMRIHSGSKPHVCSICMKSFKRANELRRHQRTHEHNSHRLVNRNSAQYLCHVCSKVLISKQSLDCHLKRHRKVSLFICSVCGKDFKVMSSMKSHEEKFHKS